MRVRQLRLARGLKQEGMCRFGFEYKYYQRIEYGQKNLSLKNLNKLAKAFVICGNAGSGSVLWYQNQFGTREHRGRFNPSPACSAYQLRADEFAVDLQSLPLTIAFSFFKFDVGGLFVIVIRIQDDSIIPKLRKRLPEIEAPAVEGVHGLDDKHAGNLIENALGRNELHVVVAANGSSGIESFLARSQVRQSAPPHQTPNLTFGCRSLLRFRPKLLDEGRALLVQPRCRLTSGTGTRFNSAMEA
jgi:hypothetical protein